ncbi:tetratricopeptide repeat protein [Comamonas sp. J-3]|uniref:tetratricopeptide repeat protein n=1 Tax=Comamonas trifloxystrobinivorans TaxID=3350256 RepID=UPI00372CDBAD
MYTYKCKSVGDCSVANRGEHVTSENLLNDPKCSDCNCPLELIDSGDTAARGGAKGGSKVGVMAAVAAAVVAVAGGGGWYLMGGKSKPDTVVAEAPAPAPAPAPMAVPEPPVVAPAPVAEPAPAPAVAGIVPSETETSAARREADQRLSNGQFSEAEKKAARAAALEMIKTAVAKLGQGDLDGADRELMQARERDATESLVYYNLAIVRLRQKQPDEALKQLEAAFMAGFNHFDAMDKDTDLDPLRNTPKFRELMGLYRKSV